MMKGEVRKIGNSKGFIVDAEYLNKYDIQVGDIIHWEPIKIERKKIENDKKNL